MSIQKPENDFKKKSFSHSTDAQEQQVYSVRRNIFNNSRSLSLLSRAHFIRYLFGDERITEPIIN